MYQAFCAENTPARNYNLRSMRAWRREKAWFRGYDPLSYSVVTAARAAARHVSGNTALSNVLNEDDADDAIDDTEALCLWSLIGTLT